MVLLNPGSVYMDVETRKSHLPTKIRTPKLSNRYRLRYPSPFMYISTQFVTWMLDEGDWPTVRPRQITLVTNEQKRASTFWRTKKSLFPVAIRKLNHSALSLVAILTMLPQIIIMDLVWGNQELRRKTSI